MRRGARPKPTALKELAGNPGKRSLNSNEPIPEKVVSLEPPEWADLSERAKSIWRRVAPLAHRMGVFTKADIEPMIRYCDYLARWYEMKQTIDEHGTTFEVRVPVYETEGTQKVVVDYRVDKVVVRPEARMYQDLDRNLTRLEGEFGFTPSARSRISVAGGVVDPNESDLKLYFG